MSQGFSQHIGRLVYLALILVLDKIIIYTHHGSIIEIARHYLLLGEIGSKVRILHPEERILGSGITKIVFTCHNRTQGDYLGMECGSMLVVVCGFFHIVRLYLTRRNIAVIEGQSSILTLIIDVIIVHKSLGYYTILVVETLMTIQAILIGTNTTAQHQLEHIGKEIHLTTDRLHRIIQWCIGIII